MTKLRKIVASISALVVLGGVVPQINAAGPFSDVPEGNEFSTFIQDLKDKGIVSGVGSTGMYYPLRNVSRGEMMKMVVNAMKKSVEGRGSLEVLVNVPMLPGAPHFSDVPAGSSFYNHVELGYALGIVQGREAPAAGRAGVFGVDSPVLRQEAMKMIIRAYRIFAGQTFMQDLTGGPSFDDVATSSEFYDYIQTAYNLNMVNGYGNSRFGPMDPMRRDQMAKVVSNAMRVFVEGKPLSVGVPASVQIGSSDPQIRNDGTSTSTITCTVVDRNGNRVGDWTQPMVFTTDAGTLRIVGTSEAASNTKTIPSDKGRGTITLTSSTTAGTATVKCKTGTYEGTTRVEFTSAAPTIRNGFGSAQIAGVGELNVRITDDHIVAKDESRPFGANSSTAATPAYATSNATVDPINGFATIEAFVYDDEGDPTCGDTIIISIKEGNGHLIAGAPNQGETNVPTAPQASSSAVRALTLNGTTGTSAGNCMNGRYVAYLNVLDTQNEGNVTIQVLNRSTAPSLITTASVQIDLVTLHADVYHDSILTRNAGQIGLDYPSTLLQLDKATSQNIAPVIIKTLDENNEPFLTVDTLDSGINDEDEDDIECRFISGPVEDAKLEGDDPSSVMSTYSNRAFAHYIKGSAGMYVLNVFAGTNPGTLVVECRDVDSIGQPAVRFSVNVEEPEIELFVSSRTIGDGQVSTIMARVTAGPNKKPVFGEQLRLQMDGGDGELDTIAGAGYSRTDGSDWVYMDKICYDTTSAHTTSESLLQADSSNFAGVGMMEFDGDCSTLGLVESGWYTAKLFGPEHAERDQTQTIRVTDISRGSQPPEDTIQVDSTTDNISDLDNVVILPIREDVGINQDIPTIIFAQDQDYSGLACAGTSALLTTNGEAFSGILSAGCNLVNNGFTLDPSDGIAINRHTSLTPTGATLGTLAVNPTDIENVRIFSRGTGTVDTQDHWSLYNIGGGAYFMVARAKDRQDRGYWEVEGYDSSGVPQSTGEVNINIWANTVQTEFNLPDTIPDWNNTLIAYVSDENEDPVVGLESCRPGTYPGTFPTNNFTDFVVTRGGADVQDIVPVADVPAVEARFFNLPHVYCLSSPEGTDLLAYNSGVGKVGTGLYAFNVDTNRHVTPGTVTLTVSLNQATNPHDQASYRIQDPTLELTAWPNHVTSSNTIPLTVIVRDDDGDPLDVDENLASGETLSDRLQVELVSGSGNLEQTNIANPNDGLRAFLGTSDDGVYAGSYKASSVTQSVNIVSRVNAISSRVEDSIAVAVD